MDASTFILPPQQAKQKLTPYGSRRGEGGGWITFVIAVLDMDKFNIKVMSCAPLIQFSNICELISLLFFSQNSDEFISRKLEELLNLMIEVLPYCHFSAKRHRLDSLYFLIVHMSKVISKILKFIYLQKSCCWECMEKLFVWTRAWEFICTSTPLAAGFIWAESAWHHLFFPVWNSSCTERGIAS